MGFNASEYLDEQERWFERRKEQMFKEWVTEIEAHEQQESYKTKNINAMAEKKEYKKKVARMYRNDRATKENKQPLFNLYLHIEEPLKPGEYKLSLWENEYQGKISYDSTKIEVHAPQQRDGNGGNQRMSNNQYKDNTPAPTGDDLPF